MPTIDQYLQIIEEQNRLGPEENLQITKEKKVYTNKKHPFYYRAKTINSRARRLNIAGTITIEDLNFIFNKFDGKCVICGNKSNLCFDHIKSFYRGGENVIDNIQLLCRKCNMEKGVN